MPERRGKRWKEQKKLGTPLEVASPIEVAALYQDKVQSYDPSSGISFFWAEELNPHPRISPEKRLNHGLNAEDLPTVGLSLLRDDFDACRVSLEQTTKRNIAFLSNLRTWRLQSGHFAYILMHQAVFDEQPYFFVSCLSRGSLGTLPAVQLEADFHNLSSLSRSFRTKLKPAFQDKFSVVRPIARGEISYKDKSFPFYTMPFVPLGELGVYVIELMGRVRVTRVIPFFSYAKPYNERMESARRQAADGAQERAEVYAQCFGKNSFKEFNKLRSTQIYKRQREDLLLAEMLLYLLADGYFPQQHLINAGDWMAFIGRNGLHLKLISLRGGLAGPYSKREFFKYLVTHREPVEKYRICPDGSEMLVSHEIQLFQDLTFSKFEKILDEAQGMLEG